MKCNRAVETKKNRVRSRICIALTRRIETVRTEIHAILLCCTGAGTLALSRTASPAFPRLFLPCLALPYLTFSRIQSTLISSTKPFIQTAWPPMIRSPVFVDCLLSLLMLLVVARKRSSNEATQCACDTLYGP